MIMTRECKLTTIDNPFDPFEQFDEWFLFDIEKGYDCCGRLMRIANITDDMMEAEADVEIERAIDEIVSNDILGIYKKVVRESKNNKMATV